MSEYVAVEFEGTIDLTREELAEAGGDARAAVQTAIGATGVVVDGAQVNDYSGPKNA